MCREKYDIAEKLILTINSRIMCGEKYDIAGNFKPKLIFIIV